MKHTELSHFFKTRRCTLIGIGPVSKNSVDAAIELSNEHSIPLMLIASRRQIEMEALGGGYVNNWSTEKFSEYVIDQDKRGKIILARDHGGPWQNPVEITKQMSLRKAMDSAKQSFEADIVSGFDMVHLDPSIDIFGQPSIDEVLQRVFELYEFCYSVSRRLNRDLIFEVGTDEQSSGVQDIQQFEYCLESIQKFCRREKFPLPTFIVAQTGTKVMEMQNVGAFDSPFRIERELPIELHLPRILKACERYDIWLKEHNADYLSDESLLWHPKLGIHAANVAPEFGVVESKAIVECLEANGLEKILEKFLALSYNSKKWEKWMLPQTKASDRDRAIISGHYVFASSAFQDIKREAQAALQRKNIDFDQYLKQKVKKSIYRYLKLFNLLEPNL